MFTRRVAARIAVMYQPDIAGDVLLQNHDVTRSNRRHARCRSSARETTPIRRQIQFGNDPSKLVQRCLASAERVRASGRTSTDDSLADLHIASDRRHRVQILMPISEVVVPIMVLMVGVGFRSNGRKQ